LRGDDTFQPKRRRDVTFPLGLAVLVVTAHALGWLAERVKQPALLGHMLAGVLWGPFVLDGVHPDRLLSSLSDVSVMAVVVAAGLEMRLRDVRRSLSGGGLLALGPAFLFPAVGGALFARLAGETVRGAIVVGLCTSVTALPVALRILNRAGLLQSRIAGVAISGALVGDLIVLAGLALMGTGGAVAMPYAVVGFLVSLLASDVVDRFETSRRVRHVVAAITTAVFAPFSLSYQGVQIAPAAAAAAPPVAVR
jgi:Kef-type K+ transport system membrane component KefB